MQVSYGPLSLGIGMFLKRLAILMLFPCVLAIYTATIGVIDFLISAVITYTCAQLFEAIGHRSTREQFRLGIRDMFLLTTLVWLTITIFAALPFVLIEHITYSDAFFETMSGLTTTGSTVLSNLDGHDPAILLWRSLLHWFGGIGFIVVGVAILPGLNVGGMRLFRTESSDWSDKAVPKTQGLAKRLVVLYIAISSCCALAYLAAGMNWFDAINHAMSTVSTGGFSTHDQSMSFFSHEAQWVAIFFMTISSLSFVLLTQSITQLDLKGLIRDQQSRGFVLFVAVASLIFAAWLYFSDDQPLLDALRIGTFNVVSIISTTGFALGDFTQWGSFAIAVVLVLMFCGGCSGSTAGGVKIFRYQIGFMMLNKQIRQQIQPKSAIPMNYNGKALPEGIAGTVISFMIVYQLTIIVIAVLLTLTGLDLQTSLSSAITAVGNVGPGLTPEIGPSGNFGHLSDTAKLALSFGMLLGRLEIITVIVLLAPRFWRD